MAGSQAAHEADLILRHRLGLEPHERILHARGEVGPVALEHVQAAVTARADGLPLAYAIERAEFAGLTFLVTPAVLIPRPETEFLVQQAVWWMKEERRNSPTLLDLGCGSGCVGITLAARFPELEVTLTDVSPAALDVAQLNAERLGVIDRCRFYSGDWFTALKRRERFNMVLCNPPYITRRDDPLLEATVKEHEPSLALFLEEEPEEFFFRLGRKAVSHLHSGGLFAVEVGYDTAWPARCAFDKVNALARGRNIHDFAGIERIIWGLRR